MAFASSSSSTSLVGQKVKRCMALEQRRDIRHSCSSLSAQHRLARNHVPRTTPQHSRRRGSTVPAAQGNSGPDPLLNTVSQIASQALSSGALSSIVGTQQPAKPPSSATVAYYLITAIALLFLLGPTVKTLSTPLILSHAKPMWWQFITSGWLIEGWRHLAQNAFFICVFGKAVERLQGGAAMVLCFLVSGIAGSLASYALLPKKAGIMSGGPEAGVFGLVCMATLFSRLPWSWPRALELLCIAPFVTYTIASTDMALAPLMMLNKVKVGHFVPLVGGMAGAALVALVCAGIRRVQEARSKARRAAESDAVLEDPVLNGVAQVASFFIKKVL